MRRTPVTADLTRLVTPRRLALAATLAATATLFGCYTEGGGQMSMDRFTYVSRPSQPKTISLVDTRTFEAIWSIDIPVGQQVALQFSKNPHNREGVPADPFRPDIMRWGVMAAGKTGGDLNNAIAVPASESRRLEMKLRPPELPDTAPHNASPAPLHGTAYNDESPPEFKQPPPPAPTPAPAPNNPATTPPAQALPVPPENKPADPPVDLPPPK